MDRISRSVMLMRMAQVVALRGTCSRAKVGAVISKDGRILTLGYNGAPKGLPHCTHESWKMNAVNESEAPTWLLPLLHNRDMPFNGYETFYWDGVSVTIIAGTGQAPGCQVSEHAERNAIAWSARTGVALEGAQIHCTHAPCLDCARAIINAGIECVSYVIPYRLTAGVELLEQAGIQVIAMADPS